MPQTLAPHLHIALLRGINVGGKHLLLMTQLSEMFILAGATAVRTYIASGNVVFDCPPGQAGRIASSVAAAIDQTCGFAAPVVIRSAEHWTAMIRANPFVSAGCDPQTLHVACLAAVPTPHDLLALDPQRSFGDRWAVVGREVFLHLPNGTARSKITTAWLDGALHTVSTVRNWRTVVTLQQLIIDCRSGLWT